MYLCSQLQDVVQDVYQTHDINTEYYTLDNYEIVKTNTTNKLIATC